MPNQFYLLVASMRQFQKRARESKDKKDFELMRKYEKKVDKGLENYFKNYQEVTFYDSQGKETFHASTDDIL